jgi:hypothetical protein
VVRERDLLARERVDPGSHAFGLAAIVHEDQRRARRADALEHERRDGGPHRSRDIAQIGDR